MTIRPGQEWGRARDGVEPVAVADSDTALARLVEHGTSPLAVAAGDLHRAIGGPRLNGWRQVVPVDALVVRVDGGPEQVAVAHVVARRSWWRGQLLAVCNVDYVGVWNVAPRAHPNDGRADVVDVAASMRLRARWQAWRRLPAGTHVPHPSISTRSVREASFQFSRPMRVWLDGVPAGTATRLDIAVRADAFELLV